MTLAKRTLALTFLIILVSSIGSSQLARQWVADHTILLHHQPVSFLGGRTWR